MGESGYFKTTAFGGFEKASVLQYIDGLNAHLQSVEQDYEAKLAEYAKAQASQLEHIQSLEAQLADLRTQLTQAQERTAQEHAAAQQYHEQLLALEEKNKELQKQLSAGERELQIQLERNRQLQFQAENLGYKGKKYDEISAQIGQTLIEAKRSAEQIIGNAEQKAQEIVRQSQTYMLNFRSELGSFQNDAARLRKSIEEILFVLNDRVDVMQEIVQQVEERFTPPTALDYSEDSEAFEPAGDPLSFLHEDDSTKE